ncbi:uncharacterized protein METZ01_LOCUS159978, partial [marine metagenome]
MPTTEPLSHLVDQYRDFLHENSPTAASADGVHTYDDRIEDLSRAAIDDEVQELGGFVRRLDRVSTRSLTAEEQLERRLLADQIRGRLFELEEVRSWQRDPRHYAELLTTSLAGQTLFDYAPVEERARRVVSKLRQTPRLIEAAEANVEDPSGIFIKTGAEAFDDAVAFIERDLPRAFGQLEDLHLLGDLADASTEATGAIGRHTSHLRGTLARRSRATFRLGRERFEERLRYRDGISLSAERLLAVAERELDRTQEQFREVAGRLNPRADAADVWRDVKARHPAPGQLVQMVRGQLEQLLVFVERNSIVTVPAEDSVIVSPAMDFYRRKNARLWSPGPFEPRSLPSHYYVSDVDPAWSAERTEEHLRDLNLATLWSISVHETYPGHFLHFNYQRRTKRTLRKSTLFAPVSFVEGWAHYCEQMMVEAGLAREDETIELGQLARALLRFVRMVVAIRLHTEDMSVEQGVRAFQDKAYLEEGNARR